MLSMLRLEDNAFCPLMEIRLRFAISEQSTPVKIAGDLFSRFIPAAFSLIFFSQ